MHVDGGVTTSVFSTPLIAGIQSTELPLLRGARPAVADSGAVGTQHGITARRHLVPPGLPDAVVRHGKPVTRRAQIRPSTKRSPVCCARHAGPR